MRCPSSICLHPTPLTNASIHSLSRPHREGASTLIWTHLSSRFCLSSFPISQPCCTSHSSLCITAPPLHRLLLPLQVRTCLGLQLLKYLPWTLSTDLSLSLSSPLNIYAKIVDFLASCLFFNPVTLSIAIASSHLTFLPRGAVEPLGLLSRRGSLQPCILLPAPPGSHSPLPPSATTMLPSDSPCRTHFRPGLNC